MRRTVVVVAVVIATAATAAAQSKRYPPTAVDRDAIDDQQSTLWEAASDPARAPYESMLALARQQIDARSQQHLQEAITQLDQAIAMVPTDPRAYRLRGEAKLSRWDWAGCADDLATAWTRIEAAENTEDVSTGTATDEEDRLELRLQLGVCQARAARFPDAERTLAEAAASGSATSEVWMRLGEVRIAQGKLEEAIAALGAARESADNPLASWLLAGAYDRARRPREALDWAHAAIQRDRSLSTLRSPAFPLLGKGEDMYLLGLATSAQEPSNPEAALGYFRKFLQEAPQSPWRKRAQEHVQELQRIDFPETVVKLSGNGTVAMDAAQAVIRKAMPQLRACLAKLPYAVLSVRVTKLGPRSKQIKLLVREDLYELDPYSPFASPRRRPPSKQPDPTTTFVQLEPMDTGMPSPPDADAAIRCVEPQASKLALPLPKELDSFYTLAFRIAAP